MAQFLCMATHINDSCVDRETQSLPVDGWIVIVGGSESRLVLPNKPSREGLVSTYSKPLEFRAFQHMGDKLLAVRCR